MFYWFCVVLKVWSTKHVCFGPFLFAKLALRTLDSWRTAPEGQLSARCFLAFQAPTWLKHPEFCTFNIFKLKEFISRVFLFLSFGMFVCGLLEAVSFFLFPMRFLWLQARPSHRSAGAEKRSMASASRIMRRRSPGLAAGLDMEPFLVFCFLSFSMFRVSVFECFVFFSFCLGCLFNKLV